MQSKLLASISIAISCLSLKTVANSGYAASCNSIGLYAPSGNAQFYALIGNCAEESGIYNVDAGINLNYCLVNGGGILYAQVK
jgi:hypothetical protein